MSKIATFLSTRVVADVDLLRPELLELAHAIAAEESVRIMGEVLPMDRTPRATGYTGITPFGQVVNKTQYMADLAHTEDTDVADEYVVRFFDGGKLAVMTHRGTVNGKPTYRSTHVWLKHGNTWQLIQNHVSNISEPPATPVMTPKP